MFAAYIRAYQIQKRKKQYFCATDIIYWNRAEANYELWHITVRLCIAWFPLSSRYLHIRVLCDKISPSDLGIESWSVPKQKELLPFNFFSLFEYIIYPEHVTSMMQSKVTVRAAIILYDPVGWYIIIPPLGVFPLLPVLSVKCLALMTIQTISEMVAAPPYMD